jgi:nucleoside-diphosphate-sugar epimerase
VRILITGALGFIGSHLADAYIAQGHDVIGVDNMSGNVVNEIDGMALTFHSDVATHLPVCAVDADLVVHAASPVGAVALLSNDSIVAEIIESTQAVLRYCERVDATLINISSSEVYGFSGVYRETDPCVVPHRLTHRLQYAAGKLAAEQLARTSRVPSITVRPFNVAGPRQTSAKGFVLPTFVEQAINGEPLTVFGGAQQRSLTAVWDVVDFIVRATSGMVFNGKGCIVNVGNPANRTTVDDLAHRVIDILGSDSGIRYTDGKTVHGPQYEEAEGVIKIPDITLARSLGWEPRIGLDDMITRTAEEAGWLTNV